MYERFGCQSKRTRVSADGEGRYGLKRRSLGAAGCDKRRGLSPKSSSSHAPAPCTCFLARLAGEPSLARGSGAAKQRWPHAMTAGQRGPRSHSRCADGGIDIASSIASTADLRCPDEAACERVAAGGTDTEAVDAPALDGGAGHDSADGGGPGYGGSSRLRSINAPLLVGAAAGAMPSSSSLVRSMTTGRCAAPPGRPMLSGLLAALRGSCDKPHVRHLMVTPAVTADLCRARHTRGARPSAQRPAKRNKKEREKKHTLPAAWAHHTRHRRSEPSQSPPRCPVRHDALCQRRARRPRATARRVPGRAQADWSGMTRTARSHSHQQHSCDAWRSVTRVSNAVCV